MGDLVVEGTATAGGGATLDDTNNLLFANDNDIAGAWLAIYEGAAIGDERPINAFTASSDRITVIKAFSATPDTTSDYIVTRRWRPQMYLDAVAAAIRRAQHFQLFALDDLTGHFHELITLGDILATDGNANGQFEDTSGTFPTGWTIDSNTTIAVDTGVDNVRRGRSSAKMTSDGTNLAQIRESVLHFERYADSKVTLRAKAQPKTVNRCLIRVGDGGVSTAVTATHADGADVWEELEATLTLSADPKGLDVDCEISSGGAVITFFDDVRLIWDAGTIYEYDLPSRLAYLSKVEIEIGSASQASLRENAWETLPRNFWKVQGGASPKLVFIPENFTPPKDRHIRLTGQAHPATITAATPATAWAETVEANAEYVKAYAKWYLLNSLPYEMVNEDIRRQIRDAQSVYLEMEDQLRVPVMPGSELVRAT